VLPPPHKDADTATASGTLPQQLDSHSSNTADGSALPVATAQCASSVEELAVNPVPAPIPEDDGADADINIGAKPKFEKMKLRENRRKTFIAEAFIEDEPDLPPAAAPSKPSAVTTDRRRRAMQSMPLAMPVNFGPLDISVLKKYKKCFKVPAKANACKEELLSVIAKHFLQLKVDEAKTVKSCIKKVRRMHKLADI
jgi:hypothetical protein